MTRIVTTKLHPDKAKRGATKGRRRSVVEKRVRQPDGRYVVVLKVDAGSDTFTDDLSYVFAKNVARARRENKRLLGTADFAPSKR